MSFRTRLLAAGACVLASAVLRDRRGAGMLLFKLSVKLSPEIQDYHVELAHALARQMWAAQMQTQTSSGSQAAAMPVWRFSI